MRYNDNQGLTLLEMMLVLAIMASIIVMGLRQYASFKVSSDINQTVYNVDAIFLAAANYYYANCGTQSGATLAPTVATPPVINIGTDLIAAGYLENFVPFTPIVDMEAAGTYNGYLVQFNRSTADRTVNGTKIGTIVSYQIQVSVALKDASLTSVMLKTMAAACVTSRNATGNVVDCASADAYQATCSSATETMNSNAPGSPAYNSAQNNYTSNNCTSSSGNYVTFIRSPANSAPLEAQSGLWMANATLKQFNQTYTTYPMTYLMSTSHTPEYQYFYCGS